MTRPVAPPQPTDEPTDDQRGQVFELVAAAEEADGTRPLSEQFLLGVRGTTGDRPTHLLAYAGQALAGYAQLAGGAAELVVAPTCRRHGVGSALLAGVPQGYPVWAHGDLAAARAFAAAHGLHVVRELWVLGRRFEPAEALDEAALPPGLVSRPFRPGRDEDEWLRVNAAAFAHHAEQGHLTRADLDARMAEPWFDPAGFILVVPEEDPDRVAAFHWTKVHPPASGHRDEPVGEVYVLGVDPAYQGKGLGRPLTLLGLAHLRACGVTDVILYVDGDNPAALTVYRRLGFTTRSVDRMYARGRPLHV